MKRYLFLLLVLVLTIVPVITFAKEEQATKVDLKKYKTMNFSETLKDEEMELKYKDYKEDDKQTIIYLFRGRGCGYCRSFLTFLNDISEEYGQYFKVVSFESWYEEENSKLLDKISTFLENPAGGVPYIIIGEQVFPGYASNYDDSIKTVIMKEYNKKDRYDVIEAYNESIKFHFSDTEIIVLLNLLFVLVSTVAILFYIKKSNEKLLDAINNRPMNKVVEAVKKEKEELKAEAKKVKKQVKKVVKKTNAKTKKK